MLRHCGGASQRVGLHSRHWLSYPCSMSETAVEADR